VHQVVQDPGSNKGDSNPQPDKDKPRDLLPVRLEGKKNLVNICTEPDKNDGNSDHQERCDEIKSFPAAPYSAVEEPDDGCNNPAKD
jgi:hypothetical protein